MANVHDVAAYILSKCGELTTWKLQKLVYYSQAWSVVWDERPLFNEPIQAWANGPVIPALYEEHKGLFSVSVWSKGDINNLDYLAIETIDAVVRGYGNKSGQWLSDLTHSEKPWKDARIGVPEGERSTKVITPDALLEYYSSLKPEQQIISEE